MCGAFPQVVFQFFNSPTSARFSPKRAEVLWPYLLQLNKADPYHYLCDYQNGSIFLAAPDKDNSSDTFPMQLTFCDRNDHSAITFELSAHPDIDATLQGERFLAKNISLEQYGKSLVLQHEDSGMITKADILKAKNLSSLLRMTENFCGE